MFNIVCHALSFNVWPRPPFIRMKNFDPISSGPVFKYLKGVRFLGLKFRGFFLFRNKIHVNAKIKSRDFFRITATSKFKPSEILNFYQPQFSILVNHWVKILMREKFSVCDLILSENTWEDARWTTGCKILLRHWYV